VNERLPWPVSSRGWENLSQCERGFFHDWDEYLPLPPNYAAQIRLLLSDDARRLNAWADSAIPYGWPERSEQRFRFEEELNVDECWKDEEGLARVRGWLFDRGIPFRRTVYLLYDRQRVVETTWKMVVRDWDAFSWNVGDAMFAIDHTLQWAGCFHHESVFIFGSQSGFRPTVNARRIVLHTQRNCSLPPTL
jgi:hypothetical protein